MAIVFNETTFDRIPFAKLEFDTSLLNPGGDQVYRALIIGESSLAQAPAEDGPLAKPVRVVSEKEISTKVGTGAAAEMTKAWLKRRSFINVFALGIKSKANLKEFTDAIEVLKTQGQFHIVICQQNEPAYLAALGTLLDEIGKADQGKITMAFCAKSGTYEQLAIFNEGKPAVVDGTPASDSHPVNYKFLSVLASPVLKKRNADGTASNTPVEDYMIATSYAIAVAPEAQKDPARPFNALELLDIPPPAEDDQFQPDELNKLVETGMAVYGVNANRKPELLRAVSTYTKNSDGTPDDSFADINVALISSYLRYSFVSYFYTKFVAQRYKLADDDIIIPPNAPVLQPKTGKAEAVNVFNIWKDKVLVQNEDLFMDSLICEKQGRFLAFMFAAEYIDILLGTPGKLLRMVG